MPAAQVVAAVLGAGVLALAILAFGARVRRLLSLPVTPALRLPVDLLVGGWAYAVAALLLGLLHAWHWATLAGVALALAAAGRFSGAGWRWATAAPAAAAGLLVLPVALAPPFFYDALVYHLGLPWQALLEHGLRAHPEDLFAAFPPLAQLLNAPLLAAGLERAPAVIHWLAFVAAGAAVSALARALGAPGWGAVLAGACLPLLPCAALVAGLPASEAWYVAAAVTAFAVLAQRRLPAGGEALVGLLAGVAAAARLQGLPWGLVILAVVLWRMASPRSLAVAAAGWIAGAAPWWVKNLALLGDPVAPLLWHREGMATLWRDAGSAMHAAAGAGQLWRTTLAAALPQVSYLAPLLLAGALAATVHARPRDRAVALAVVAGLAGWALTGNLPRFLAVPVALTVALAAAAGGRSRAGRWASALTLGVTLALGTAVSLNEMARWRAASAALAEPAAVRARLVVNDPSPAFTAAAALPADARVLFVGEPRGLGFPRRFVAPSQHDVSPLRGLLRDGASPAQVCERLRAAGFTHLLVNWGELARLERGYPVAPWADVSSWRRWNAFIAALGPPSVQAGAVAIFALPGANPPAV